MGDITASPNPRTTPLHVWIVAVLAILWTAAGAFDYLATQLELESYTSQFSEEQLAYFHAFPAWMVALWAIGVWGAFLGSIALLLRRRWAVWLYGASLGGLAGSTIYNFGLTNGAEIMGDVGVVMTIAIWVIAIALFLYALAQSKKGVLR